MPSGKYTNEETRKEIQRLRAQGLSYKVIAMRTGLHKDTVYKLLKRSKVC